MTKEEITDKLIRGKYFALDTYSEAFVHNAMDEYAKQQCIAFTKWTLEGDCQYSATDEDQWTNINDSTDSITTEQLYELWLKECEH